MTVAEDEDDGIKGEKNEGDEFPSLASYHTRLQTNVLTFSGPSPIPAESFILRMHDSMDHRSIKNNSRGAVQRLPVCV